MRRTSLVWLAALAIVGLLASSLVAQEASKSQVQPQAEAKPDGKAESEAGSQAAEPKDDDKKGSKGDFKDESKASPPPILLPQMLVIGKIEALCAADQYLVKIRPFGPQFAGTPPCPPWLLVNAKNTPQAPSLLLKAAEESWTVAVYYDPTWTVTSVCVRFFPDDDD